MQGSLQSNLRTGTLLFLPYSIGQNESCDIMELMLVSPPNSYVAVLTPNVIIFGGGVFFGRQLN